MSFSMSSHGEMLGQPGLVLLLKYLLACTHSSCSLGSAQFSFGLTPNQVWYKYQDNMLVTGILRMEQKIQRKPCGTVTLR